MCHLRALRLGDRPRLPTVRPDLSRLELVSDTAPGPRTLRPEGSAAGTHRQHMCPGRGRARPSAHLDDERVLKHGVTHDPQPLVLHARTDVCHGQRPSGRRADLADRAAHGLFLLFPSREVLPGLSLIWHPGDLRDQTPISEMQAHRVLPYMGTLAPREPLRPAPHGQGVHPAARQVRKWSAPTCGAPAERVNAATFFEVI